jgi:cytochrome P450
VNVYMLAKRREKRAKPTDDIISVLSSVRPKTSDRRDGDEGSEPSDGEFLTIVQQLVIAGTENTTAGILSAIHELARSPETFARLRADPTLIEAFVEVMLRLEAPGSGFVRLVKQDTEIGGVKIPKGGIGQLRYAAANRDPAQFECPAQMDLGRRDASQHPAFGGGPHGCIGQILARKELVCAVRTICARMAHLSLDSAHAQPRYTHTFFLRCLDSLHLSFTAAP